MSSIVIQGDTSGSITVAAPSVAGTHTLTLPKATGNIATDATVGLGMKNRVINGNMVIDQRNTSQTGNGYSVDRWAIYDNTSATYTLAQDTEAPTDFITSLKFTTTGTDTSIGSTEQCVIYHQIEGNNIADFNWGTANAKTVTLSFWVRSSLTGTFAGSLGNNGYARCYPFTYTISAADTWEQKTITITGDTTGTWLTTNGVGISLRLAIAAGSSFEATANAWASGNYFSVSGATNVVGTASSTFYITGVQLEVGENATPFEYRMYGTELALCQRYYQKFAEPTNSYGMIVQTAYTTSTTNINSAPQFIVPMRTKPSSVTSSTLCFRRYDGSIQGGTFSSTTIDSATNSTTGCLLNNTSTSVTAGWVGSVIQHNSASGYLAFSAEL